MATLRAPSRRQEVLEPKLGPFAPADEPQSNLGAQQALELLAALLSHGKPRDAATALATELARRFDCVQVAIGLLPARARKPYVQVLALSHNADFEAQQSLLREIAAAMDECADQADSLVWPVVVAGKPRITHAHAQLSHRLANAALCSVPIVHAGGVRGALMFVRTSDQPFAPGTVAVLEHLACLLGPVVDLQAARERPLASLARERWANRLSALGQHAGFKLGAAATLAALLLAALIPVQYRVSAPARLEGAVQRVLAAPNDAYLKQVHVRPGAFVKQGQVLLELERDSFDLEKRKWESEIAQHEGAYRDAIAKHDRAGVVSAQARMEEARAQLALVSDKLGRAQITAPFDGVVIDGDLSQSLGAPIKQGEALVTIAPRDDYRVMLEVDERDVAAVTQNATGALALAAIPGEVLDLRVVRLTPVAQANDGRNYFEVEARLAKQHTALRPGLKGVAKVDAGRRSLLWIWSHRALDALRMLRWSWSG